MLSFTNQLFQLRGIWLHVVMLSVVMLDVVMLSVVTPAIIASDRGLIQPHTKGQYYKIFTVVIHLCNKLVGFSLTRHFYPSLIFACKDLSLRSLPSVEHVPKSFDLKN